MKLFIFFVILVIGLIFTFLDNKKTSIKKSVIGIVASIALSIFSSFLYDEIISLFSKSNNSSQTASIEEVEESKYKNDTDKKYNDEEVEGVDTSSYDDTNNSQESVTAINYIADVSNKVSFSGNIITENQKDTYKYISSVNGTYRFDTELSSGGSVIVRISGENGDTIDYNNDALSIDLEAGQTYILNIEYRNGVCDYTVNIGKPVSISDISNNSSVSGSITYQDQKDKYYYTSPITGTYRFDTNLSSGGSVIIRISGENDKSIDYNNDALTIDLEAGKKYIFSVEYRNGICDYIVKIGVPIPVNDISGNPSSISGSITYQDQKDKYYYTAPVSGTYRFDTDLSSGSSVIVRISGENDKSIDYNNDDLTIDLEAGKKYILSIEYRSSTCDYTFNTGIPIPITDISSNNAISGNITYQDQKDKYYYTAPSSGTYNFNTNLSSGGSVIIRISGENNKSIDYNNDDLTIDLEAGKKYILSIEYRNSFCSYDAFILNP